MRLGLLEICERKICARTPVFRDLLQAKDAVARANLIPCPARPAMLQLRDLGEPTHSINFFRHPFEGRVRHCYSRGKVTIPADISVKIPLPVLAGSGRVAVSVAAAWAVR